MSSSHEQVVLDTEEHYEPHSTSSFEQQQQQQQQQVEQEQVIEEVAAPQVADTLSAFFFSHRLEQEYGDDLHYFTGTNKPSTAEFARLHLLYSYVRRSTMAVLALLMLFMFITIILSSVHMGSDVVTLASTVITNTTLLSIASTSLAAQSNSASFQLTSVAMTNTSSLMQGLTVVAFLHLFLIFTAWQALTKQNRTAYGYFVVSVFISGLVLFSVGSAVNSHASSATTLVQEGWEAVFVDSSPLLAQTVITSYTTNLTTTNSLLTSLESSYSCCGLFSFNDTFAVSPCPTFSSSMAQQSCLMPLSSQFTSECHTVGGAAIAFGVLELCGFAVLVVLLWQLQNERIKVASLN